MEREVEVEPGVTLWVQDLPPAGIGGGRPGAPMLLVMGANTAGPAWPDALVDRLRTRHRVVRYDHRDTGRSTYAFEEHPYAIADLAADAPAVLDACGIERAHVVGMSMGGTLAQLMALDAPEHLASVTLLCTAALSADRDGLPGPARDLLRMWQEMTDPRDERSELTWRVEHWRRLHGTALPFDPLEFRALEQRLIAHAGRSDSPAAHAQADPGGLDRGDELATITVPTLVVEAPEDPVNPPPHASYLTERIGTAARLVTIPGMGHALPSTILTPLAEAILSHAAAAEGAARRR